MTNWRRFPRPNRTATEVPNSRQGRYFDIDGNAHLVALGHLPQFSSIPGILRTIVLTQSRDGEVASQWPSTIEG
jgi:hypothetical protein